MDIWYDTPVHRLTVPTDHLTASVSRLLLECMFPCNEVKGRSMTDSEALSNQAGTMQKQAETSLRDAAWRLQSIIEGTHVGTWEWNIQTGQTVYNDVWAQIIGYTLDELTPISVKTFETFVHPDDLRHSDELLRRHFAGELPYYDYDCRMKHKDGHWVWVHDCGRVMTRAEDGKPLMMFGTHTDITERKQAEEALRESDERYRTMLGNLPGFVYRCQNDRNWTMSFISDGCRDITGYAPEDFMHNKKLAYNDIIHPDHRERLWLQVQDSLRQKKAYQYEYPIVVASGETDHWVWERGRGIFSDSGQLLYAEGFVTDITERKRAEEALRESEERYRSILNASPDAITITDLGGRILMASPATSRILGGNWEDELPGHLVTDFIVPKDRERALSNVALMFQGIMSGPGEYRGLRADGSTFALEANAQFIRNADGKPASMVFVVRDITERKRAEEERQALQARLLQSQKMEAVGTLAGGVAHDFNNLLTGILGNIALMRASLPPANPVLENLNAAETAARRAADLTKGLLTYSRNAMVMPVVLDVDAAVWETLDLLRQSLPATITIVRDFQPDTWSILADRSQLTQILLNLAVNARDAMDGRGTLTISVHNEVIDEEYLHHYSFARTGEFVHLRVSDTGPGLPEVIAQHLFEPFRTTKPVGSGTGLGLSIVYGAVKQAGGWITAVSTQGTGATFDIFLPRSTSPVDPVHIPEPVVENTRHGTILVVEDEPVVSTVARTVLSRSGYTVLTAPDGASAVNVLRDHPVDIGLILLDMTMPGMTTAEIIQAVRDLDPTVPILLNSGYTSSDSVKRMLEEGTVQGFLGKPYDLHQLLENVEELLRRS